jgi:hypothetical protein
LFDGSENRLKVFLRPVFGAAIGGDENHSKRLCGTAIVLLRNADGRECRSGC